MFNTTHHAAYENLLLNRHLDELEEDEQENEPYLIMDKKTGMMRWSDTGRFAFCWVAIPSRKGWRKRNQK